MNTSPAYTSLECLLLFQLLVAFEYKHDEGVQEEWFKIISQQLIENALINGAPTFDAKRLQPDALQELYLQLLGEELRAEVEGHEDGAESGSRQRKLPTPTLPTMEDARNHSHKLPILVERLYGRYKDNMIRSIREDERRIAQLQAELEDIEKGEWDAKLMEEDAAMAAQNGHTASNVDTKSTVKSKSPVLVPPPPSQPLPQTTRPSDLPSSKATPPLASPRPEARPDGLGHPTAVQTTQDIRSASPVIPSKSHTGAPPPPHVVPNQPSPAFAPRRPSPLQPPVQPPLQNLPPAPGPPYKWEPPYQPGPQHPHPPPQFQQQNYPPYNQSYPPPPPQPAYQQGQVPYSPHGRPPQFPVPSSPHHGHHPQPILLPPSQPSRASPVTSPGVPLDALADIAGQQQHRGPSRTNSQSSQQGLFPQHQQGPPTPGQSSHHGSPTPGGFPQQFTPMRPMSRSHSNGPPSQQWNQQYPQPTAHGLPPGPPQPFHPPNQRPSFQPRPESGATEGRQYNSPYNPNQGPRPSLPSQFGPTQGVPQTPAPYVQNQLSTGTGTRWTPNPSGPSTPLHNQTSAPLGSMDSPAFDKLSPVLKSAKLSTVKKVAKGSNELNVQSTSKEPRQGTKSSLSRQPRDSGQLVSTKQVIEPNESKQSQDPKTTSEPKETKDKEPKDSAAKQKPTPKAKPPKRGARDASIASSIPASVVSQLDESQVKEEVATPRLPDDETGDTTADDSSQPPPRLSNLTARLIAGTKRKRDEIPESAFLPPRGPPTQVLWTRNFPKISAQALEAVNGNKNAALFAQPVKARDAPGYATIIRHPQDLKSIKAAIHNGNRAAAAVEATLPSKGSGKESSVWLPISEDLVPPKGIINYSQLEKELMRMFANCVMYNADPQRGFGNPLREKNSSARDGYEIHEDGVVHDAKQMFGDVQEIIGRLRNAEMLGATGALKLGSGIVRDSSVGMGTSIRDSSAGEEDAGEETEVASVATASGSVAKRRRKG